MSDQHQAGGSGAGSTVDIGAHVRVKGSRPASVTWEVISFNERDGSYKVRRDGPNRAYREVLASELIVPGHHDPAGTGDWHVRCQSEIARLTQERDRYFDANFQLRADLAERDVQLAQAISERDEFKSMSRFSQKDEEAMDIIHRAADLLRDRGDVDVHIDLAQARARISELENNHVECARTADLERAVVEAARGVRFMLGRGESRERIITEIDQALTVLDAATATKAEDA